MWFVTYKTDDGKEVCERLHTVEYVFEWLQNWKNSKGSYPKHLLVFKAECLFDGS